MTEPSPATTPFLSLVVPARNEEENLPRCYEALTEALGGAPLRYEVLVLDNGSTDGTREEAHAICARDDRWKYVRLSRNFSAEHSISAGLRFARGEAVMIFVSDLQEPPELIPAFVEKWQEGHEIVYGVNVSRPGEGWCKRRLVDWFYRLVNWASDVHIPPHASDFRLMDRKVVDALNRMQERNRYLRGLCMWTGFRSAGIPYERRTRTHGDSKAPFWWLVGYALQAICNFSVKPLRAIFLLGVLVLTLVLGLSVFYLILTLARGSGTAGIPTLLLLLLANMGFTAVGLGVLGEYLGHIYTETKARPLWLVAETVNIDLDEDERFGCSTGS